MNDNHYQQNLYMKINLTITGCMGRMGQQLIKSSNKNKNFKIVSLTENFKIMNLEIIVPIIALIGVLILVLPGFLQTNYNFKVFFKNLSIWILVVLIILIFIYFVL